MVDPSGPGWAGPPPPPPPPVAWPGAVASPHRSLRGLATAITVLLGVAGAVALVDIPVLLNARSVVHDHTTGATFFATREVRDALDAVAGLLGLYFLVTVALAVVWMIWMWRAASNAQRYGRARQRFGPGFAIGGWFIPFANLVIPGLQMADIWRGSSPADGTAAGPPAPPTSLVWWWWIAFVIGRFSVLAVPGGVRLGRLYRLSELDTRITLSIVGDLFVVASALLAILVVLRITAAQESSMLAVSAPPTTMPPPSMPPPSMPPPSAPPPSMPPPSAPPPAGPPVPEERRGPEPPAAPTQWPGPPPSDP